MSDQLSMVENGTDEILTRYLIRFRYVGVVYWFAMHYSQNSMVKYVNVQFNLLWYFSFATVGKFYRPSWHGWCTLSGNIDGCSDNSTVYLNDPTVPRCSRKSWLAMTMFCIYILITGILLINLLIAIFRLYLCARYDADEEEFTEYCSSHCNVLDFSKAFDTVYCTILCSANCHW